MNNKEFYNSINLVRDVALFDIREYLQYSPIKDLYSSIEDTDTVIVHKDGKYCDVKCKVLPTMVTERIEKLGKDVIVARNEFTYMYCNVYEAYTFYSPSTETATSILVEVGGESDYNWYDMLS